MSKITEQDVDRAIDNVTYHRLSGRTTVCVLTLANGFEIIGQSACADPREFDEVKGRRYALENARSKVWELEGYRLREALYAADNVPGAYGQPQGEEAADTARLQDVPVMMHALAAAIEQGHHTGIRAVVVTHSGSVNAPVSIYGFGEDVTPHARAMLEEARDWFRAQDRLGAAGG